MCLQDTENFPLHVVWRKTIFQSARESFLQTFSHSVIFLQLLVFYLGCQYLQTFTRVVHSKTTCQSLPSRTALVRVLAQSSALLKESGLLSQLFAQLDDSGLPSGSVSCCPADVPPSLQTFTPAEVPDWSTFVNWCWGLFEYTVNCICHALPKHLFFPMDGETSCAAWLMV